VSDARGRVGTGGPLGNGLGRGGAVRGSCYRSPSGVGRRAAAAAPDAARVGRGESQPQEVGLAGVLGPAGPLPQVENTVGVDLALEAGQEGRPGRSRVRRGVGDPGVQGVGGHPGPQRPPADGGRLLDVPLGLPRRARTPRLAAARSAGTVSAYGTGSLVRRSGSGVSVRAEGGASGAEDVAGSVWSEPLVLLGGGRLGHGSLRCGRWSLVLCPRRRRFVPGRDTSGQPFHTVSGSSPVLGPRGGHR
jgi:hypothetical protein